MKSYNMLIVIFIIAFLFLLPLQLLAHKVNIYAYTDGAIIYSESYFADGSRCKNCTVEVYDNNTNKALLEGKTDENGRFSFNIPQSHYLKLVLKAGAGHQSSYHLNLKEASGANSNRNAQQAAVSQHKGHQDKGMQGVKDKNSQSDKIKCLSQAEIDDIVNQAIDKKIQPVMGQIAVIEERIGKADVTEIVGGIGYILGIMGIIMYFKSRKNVRK